MELGGAVCLADSSRRPPRQPLTHLDRLWAETGRRRCDFGLLGCWLGCGRKARRGLLRWCRRVGLRRCQIPTLPGSAGRRDGSLSRRPDRGGREGRTIDGLWQRVERSQIQREEARPSFSSVAGVGSLRRGGWGERSVSTRRHVREGARLVPRSLEARLARTRPAPPQVPVAARAQRVLFARAVVHGHRFHRRANAARALGHGGIVLLRAGGRSTPEVGRNRLRAHRGSAPTAGGRGPLTRGAVGAACQLLDPPSCRSTSSCSRASSCPLQRADPERWRCASATPPLLAAIVEPASPPLLPPAAPEAPAPAAAAAVATATAAAAAAAAVAAAAVAAAGSAARPAAAGVVATASSPGLAVAPAPSGSAEGRPTTAAEASVLGSVLDDAKSGAACATVSPGAAGAADAVASFCFLAFMIAQCCCTDVVVRLVPGKMRREGWGGARGTARLEGGSRVSHPARERWRPTSALWPAARGG